MVRHAHWRPCPRTRQHTATLPLRTRPTSADEPHYVAFAPTGTQLTSTDTDVPAAQTTFGHTTTGSSATKNHADQADHDAAKTNAHQLHRGCSRHLTANRPHASRPTPNQPGVHGSKRERRPSGWRHFGAPRPPTTMSANKTGTLPSRNRPTNINKLRRTVKGPTNQPQRPTSNPRPPGRAQVRPSQEA